MFTNATPAQDEDRVSRPTPGLLPDWQRHSDLSQHLLPSGVELDANCGSNPDTLVPNWTSQVLTFIPNSEF